MATTLATPSTPPPRTSTPSPLPGSPYEFEPSIGATFPTRDLLVDTITQWIFRSGLSKKVSRNDKTRYHIICRKAVEHGCPFHLAAHPNNNTGAWGIKTYVPHTCPSSAHDGYKLARSAKMLAKHHKELLKAQPNLTAKALQEMERERGVDLPYKQAWRALNRSRKSVQKEQDGPDGADGDSVLGDGDLTMEGDTTADFSTLNDSALDPRLADSSTALSQIQAMSQMHAAQQQQQQQQQQQSQQQHHHHQQHESQQQQQTTYQAAKPLHQIQSAPPTKYTLTFFVPAPSLEACRDAVFSAGAGRIGNYRNVSFEQIGRSQFMPVDGANPHTGEVGALNVSQEVRVEVQCETEEVVREAVRLLKLAHEYEEVVYWVRRLEDF